VALLNAPFVLMISRLQLVVIPSSDQERSLAFYEGLGFERRNDIPWGDGYRWVEVYPPGSTTGIALIPPRSGDPIGVQTGIILHTENGMLGMGPVAVGDQVDPDLTNAGTAGTSQALDELFAAKNQAAPIALVPENFALAPWLGVIGFVGAIVWLYGWMLRRSRAVVPSTPSDTVPR